MQSNSSASLDTPRRGRHCLRQPVQSSSAPLLRARAGASGETPADAGISESHRLAKRNCAMSRTFRCEKGANRFARCPAGKENHFHRDRRQILPRELAQKRKIKLAESVHLRNTAAAHNVGARLLHKRRVHRTARKLKRKICFRRSINLARTAVINI